MHSNKLFFSIVRRFFVSGIVIALIVLATASATAQDAPGAATGPSVEEHLAYFPIIGASSGFFNPEPALNASDRSPNAFLAWEFANQHVPNPRFTVYLEENDPSPDIVIASDLDRRSFDPATFSMNTQYYWQVVATGANGMRSVGPVWQFHTEPLLFPPAIGAMVPVPAGEFTMGCDPNNMGGFYCLTREVPLHKVYLDAYEIDKYEVTNVQYRECVQSGKCHKPLEVSSHSRDHYFDNTQYNYYPVLFVAQRDAQDYCRFAGKRLPTEAEWEKAARGPIDTRVFPWGNEFPDCSRANTTDNWTGSPWRICVYDTIRVGTLPMGASPYGAMDMSGNVFEWVLDNYDEAYYARSPYKNPLNLETGHYQTIRGGSYRPQLIYVRTNFRHWAHHGGTGDGVGDDSPFFRNDQVGFRCAR
jgi:formylglycine-generating enzyme required for sulfatase activity